MLVSGIKSRPVYAGLEPDLFARSNVIVCDRDGSDAVLEMLRRTDGEFANRSTVLLCAEGMDWAEINMLTGEMKPAAAAPFPNLDATVVRLKEILAAAKMGTRLYVAGTEPLIGSVVQTAMLYGVNHKSIRAEHRGSLKRRVQCVHCKGFTENVTTNPVKCSSCGLTLLVRDHYSRRFAAFQGVRIDAEVPGEIPEATVEYP
jgi:hypothetical protein